MKKILSLTIIISICLIGNVHALDLWGQVTDSQGRGIPYAAMSMFYKEGGFQMATTADIDGYYLFRKPGGWCEYKVINAAAPGYQTKTKYVYDDSCPTCPPVCPDDDPDCRTCLVEKRVNFVLSPGASDVDFDGVPDLDDNCMTTPNGPGLGTCTEGSRRGLSCTLQTQCGCGTNALKLPCDKWQGDADADGIGNVCDDDFNVVYSSGNPHKLMSSLSLNPYDWLALFNIWNYLHNDNTYDSFGEMLNGLANGPDVLCSTCYTHDFDGNGIGDEFEGKSVLGASTEELIEGFKNAVECCREKWEEK